MAEVSTLLMRIADYKGTSKVVGYDGWIVLKSLDTAFYANVNLNGTGSVAVGGPEMDCITFSKTQDGTDLKINMAMFGSTIFPKVEFVKVVETNTSKFIAEEVVATNFAFTSANKTISNDGEAEIEYRAVCSAVRLLGHEVNDEGKLVKFGPVGYDFSAGKKM
ncbi:hypothetical protein [Yersinia enterocolitica]|uniref:hypothetical protein n=1 Tax=Yersinia enterocolitica TaxID=630 RepID=UPI00227B5532|nr:hypothetical protein [Yersinia enterocolitica]MCY1688733.1 hypothetical protein [Yersinia enterocolitica]